MVRVLKLLHINVLCDKINLSMVIVPVKCKRIASLTNNPFADRGGFLLNRQLGELKKKS